MNLSEYLLYRDIEELNKLAEQYECDCNPHSKLELVQAIHHRMMSHTEFGRQIRQLEQTPELLYYYTLLLFQPQARYTLDELLARSKDVEAYFQLKPVGRKWLSQCLRRGWLFPVVKQGQTWFVIPDDLRAYFYPKWTAFWEEQLKKKSTGTHMDRTESDLTATASFSIINEQDAIARDTLRFLREIAARETLPLTQHGGLYKKDQQALFKAFLVHEQVLDDQRWRFGYGRRFPLYPSRFALIYDFCYHRRWIVEENQLLFLSAKGEQIMLTYTHDEEHIQKLHQEMIEYWLKTYRKPIQTLPFCFRFLLHLCTDWLKQQELFLLCRPWLNEYYYDSPQTIFERRICQMMMHLGLLSKATSEDGKVYIKRNGERIVEQMMC